MEQKHLEKLYFCHVLQPVKFVGVTRHPVVTCDSRPVCINYTEVSNTFLACVITTLEVMTIEYMDLSHDCAITDSITFMKYS